MKTFAVSLAAALVAVAGMSGAAEARPGKGKAYGHYKHHKVHRHAMPRAYYAAPRRSNRGAVAAGVAGAIIGGAIAATAQPTYRTYRAPAYRSYEAPTRHYYREEYWYE
jgi:hypothetical protein